MHILSRRTALILVSTLSLAGAGWAQQAAPRVKLATSAGDIVVELAPDKAPRTVENFLQYVRDKHYDGTVFHRVIDGFMIQGGGFTPELRQKPTRAPVPLEASNGLKNDKYTIAMARTSNPNSATSQFFINVKDNAMLNAPNPDGHGYTVFGKVVAGTEVVDKIRAVRTGNKGGMQDVPLESVTIESATVAK
ncbi:MULTISPECIES: peptidylprolyl isomerase [unclassified Variovorax]|uniref:peptidylprolyl isomerase n=1 Tax=unclassified Variovorax TaxID=663243 RepID=UPI00076C01BE|nr:MULTISPECIES: peptidylprolyl isomerase [unclassified Variovorax]KWT84361.1 Peptidyl-prolyl cis-trans isomerase ppiA precursor [Variovorax sp. WDL1]PNG52851.1 Peptidyl-prolyl cis-trans isomerase cyp18 [Variovorax sp. B4]PNG55388.1 Peptidyl-prolyl cis-trans isomerase cyp18 [Variovorax sp. B2]VTV09148.1 Peptidyl-prolyl cis-trans isomerase cyp18 [Variovorax sp. WDL1]